MRDFDLKLQLLKVRSIHDLEKLDRLIFVEKDYQALGPWATWKCRRVPHEEYSLLLDLIHGDAHRAENWDAAIQALGLKKQAYWWKEYRQYNPKIPEGLSYWERMHWEVQNEIDWEILSDLCLALMSFDENDLLRTYSEKTQDPEMKRLAEDLQRSSFARQVFGYSPEEFLRRYTHRDYAAEEAREKARAEEWKKRQGKLKSALNAAFAAMETKGE